MCEALRDVQMASIVDDILPKLAIYPWAISKKLHSKDLIIRFDFGSLYQLPTQFTLPIVRQKLENHITEVLEGFVDKYNPRLSIFPESSGVTGRTFFEKRTGYRALHYLLVSPNSSLRYRRILISYLKESLARTHGDYAYLSGNFRAPV